MRAMCRTKPRGCGSTIGWPPLASEWTNRLRHRAESRTVIAVRDFNDTPVSYGRNVQYYLRDAYRSAGAFKALAGASYIGDLPFLRIDQVWASPGWTWWTTKRVASNYPTTARSGGISWGVIKRGASCVAFPQGLQCLQCAWRSAGSRTPSHRRAS